MTQILASGFQKVVPKPVEPALLATAIGTLLLDYVSLMFLRRYRFASRMSTMLAQTLYLQRSRQLGGILKY